MEPKTLETAKIILKEVDNAKRFVINSKMSELFLSSEVLMSAMASLLGPVVDLESAYRKKMKQYILSLEENKPMSLAKAELLAKADDEYKNWQKIKMVYDLAQEQVMVIKKFADKIEYK